MPLRVAFIGAGGVNFGGHGNAWDHATRLEQLGCELEFVGIADLNLTQAESVLALRKARPNVSHMWQQCSVFQDYKVMLQAARPHCVFIGIPPGAHGSAQQPVELVCAEAGVHMFIEKPVSCAHPDAMKEFVSMLLKKSEHLVVSVAYMFRYSAAVRKMKELIDSFGPVKAVQARYNCAYSNIGAFWFDVARSGGPIVEQATHFADLARFFGGDVDLSTVLAMSVKATDPIGALSKMPIDESKLAPENRVPRVTTAMWKFKSGAIGTLTHTALLHGWAYDTQFEVLGDGYKIVLSDPYGKCEMLVRAPNSESTKLITVTPNDPYLDEIKTFVDACQSGDSSNIASTYSDAFNTYLLTCLMLPIVNLCNGDKKHRLIVDDVSTNRTLAAHLVRKVYGQDSEVTFADSGAAAIRNLTEKSVHMVLMDLRMPGMNGIETTRRIRELPTPRTRIIGITGFDEYATLRECKEAGMDVVLTKPLQESQVRELLQGPGSNEDR